MLTGFLLTVPFQQRFADLDRFQRGTYVVAVLLSATATMLVVSPVAWHRILFRHQRKPLLVRTADRFARAGLVVLAAAITAVIVLVLDVVTDDRWIGLAVGAVALLAFTVFWLLLPLLVRQRSSRG
ncbi:hypothetical protein GCM10025868_17410 [Angustibacter aerolatus]|uniref:Sodium:proton antiporter n=1 Tax=Angustibacter aerolatus TaxID=1162965 RepID=A0ABQ6JG14_9ACTN|nr:DUF6328 family protein [Angustibacter aerolatus]GMA86491.1 hypothetical protein GCM10025868_17410 [Angustibacter aerolatus]